MLRSIAPLGCVSTSTNVLTTEVAKESESWLFEMTDPTLVTCQTGTRSRANSLSMARARFGKMATKLDAFHSRMIPKLGGPRISSALRSERVAKCSPRDLNVRGKTNCTYTKAPNVGCWGKCTPESIAKAERPCLLFRWE